MSSTLTDLTAATTWSGTDLFYALVGGNSRKIAASSFLVGEATDVLSAVRSTNPQTFRIYRTFTDSSNYERLALQSGSGYVELAAQTAGTGSDNLGIRLTTAGAAGLVTLLGLEGLSQTYYQSSTTNAVVQCQELLLNCSGTVANGFGVSTLYKLENASGNDVHACLWRIDWLDATNGSEDSRFIIELTTAGSRAAQFVINRTASATETCLAIWDNDNATIERVSVGAADSGGAGFKLLRIPN